ncbi:MAG: hypothetical protein R3E01_23965 [Pirellulaceae bacterium]|nr:hypothetical protein [Planctomycetales bacterium]
MATAMVVPVRGAESGWQVDRSRSSSASDNGVHSTVPTSATRSTKLSWRSPSAANNTVQQPVAQPLKKAVSQPSLRSVTQRPVAPAPSLELQAPQVAPPASANGEHIRPVVYVVPSPTGAAPMIQISPPNRSVYAAEQAASLVRTTQFDGTENIPDDIFGGRTDEPAANPYAGSLDPSGLDSGSVDAETRSERDFDPAPPLDQPAPIDSEGDPLQKLDTMPRLEEAEPSERYQQEAAPELRGFDFDRNDAADADDSAVPDSGKDIYDRPLSPSADIDRGNDDQPGDDEPGDDNEDCDRTYNKRNCCKESEDCAEQLEKQVNNRLANIKLDVSPRFATEEPDLTKADKSRAETMDKAGYRAWTDRMGQVIANGRMENLSYGRVIISKDDGSTTSLPYMDLSDDDLCFVNAWWGLPPLCRPRGDNVARSWTPLTFTWKATALCHKPLYFEDVNLERYGHSAGPIAQPFVSGAHFFASIALFPYNSTLHPPNECIYTLGLYRPGSCAPWLVHAFPLSDTAALAEGGNIAALIGILP